MEIKTVKKILSFVLCVLLICSVCIVPNNISADAENYKIRKTYDFSNDSGTLYSGKVMGADGVNRQIARAFFSGANDQLDIYNNLKSNKAGTSGFLFNDSDGLFELRPETTYVVTLKIKVVSSQVSFKYNNYTYPTASQNTVLKLAYGMPATYAANTISEDGEIGMVAKVGTNQNTFTATQNGTDKTYNVGQWYDFTYEFTTPATFGNNGNVLGFSLKSFNGVHILIDDVNVERKNSITVDPMGGTISKTSYSFKVGEKINIENPKINKFGCDFEGWYYDKQYTKPFTDKYATEENANVKLYAKWSTIRFGFEAYTPCHQSYGFGEHFFDIVELDDAPQGKNVVYYHYTEEYWSQIRSGSEEEGNAEYYSSRRASSENNISLKRIDSNSDYIITFKYKTVEGSGDISLVASTGAYNVWVSGTYKAYESTRLTITSDKPGVWHQARIAFTTGDLGIVGGVSTDHVRLMICAASHTHTEFYIDDVMVEKAVGESTVKLDANGGNFKDGSTVKEQNVSIGESMDVLEAPVRSDYEFGGWSFNESGTDDVKTNSVDSTVFRNTLYAKWTSNMGFEAYYYDLNSPDRENYLSKDVIIDENDAYEGNYCAKLTNVSSNKQHVISLNPISNKTRYLISFYYKVSNATAPIDVCFATMNMNINNKDEVTYYPEVYTITTDEAGNEYIAGALIIETDFAVQGADRLVLLVGSKENSTYTVNFDSITVNQIRDNEGFVIFSDATGGKSEIQIGVLGEKAKLFIPDAENGKFAGWFSDRELTTIYDGNVVYSRNLNRIYMKTVKGEGFENFNVTDSNMSVTNDPYDVSNKYLTVSGNSYFKLGNVISGKKYAVEFKYDFVSSSGDLLISSGQTAVNLLQSEVGYGWQFETMIVIADTSELNFSIASNSGSNFEINIENVVFYEIDESFSVINFDQKEGYGKDVVRVGAKYTPINMPKVSPKGEEVFYGWCFDQSLKSPFNDLEYSYDEITVYARWATNPITKVSFEGVTQEEYMTSANSNRTYISGTSVKDGYMSMAFDKSDESDKSDIYTPVFDKNGYIKLESNTTYAVSFFSYYYTYTSSSKMTIEFYAAPSDKFENAINLGGEVTIKYSYNYKTGYTYITTGELNDSNNSLYIKVKSATAKTVMYLDAIVITRVDENRNHVFLYDDKNGTLYEVDGNYGQKIAYPNLTAEQFEVEGWYNTVDVIDCYDKGVHKSEKITELFCRWELKKITFDNYFYENSGSKYALGEDMSLSTDYQFDTARSLKYSYNYAIKYFETSNNTAGLGRVNDKSTYKITFNYLITEAQSDVDIKFLTAHINNRWAFITNYEEATYRIYSSEIGDGWQKATVYLTTNFESIGASGLFMTFNPVVEGATTVYIDAVELKYIGSSGAVAAFIGKDGYTVFYSEGVVGDKVNVPDIIPSSQFATFNGWYSDKECTEKFTGLTLSSDINYVYSSWTEKAESFDNYTYASKDNNNYSQNNTIVNGSLIYSNETENKNVANGFRIGKLDNEVSYKISFRYKTNSVDSVVKFVTADEMNIGVNATVYSDDGNYIKTISDGNWHDAYVYITTAFTYTVPKDANVNNVENKNADFGDMLYMYFEHDANVQISIDNIVVSEVEALLQKGSSVLTNEASEQAGSQALRFYFSYPSQNVIGINIKGENYNIIERGIIFKNARNTATGDVNGDLVTVKPIILANKDDKGYTYISKTNSFNQYWDYDNKTENVIFSGYVKNFNLKDSRLIGAKGYIKVKDANGNIYTFYSSDKKTTVKEGVDLNNEITTVKNHTFGGITWDNFTIVNPKIMPYIYGRQIEFLLDYAKQTHNVELIRVNEKAKETTYEIVIGDTNRDANDLLEVNDEDQYVIALRGTKLIIKGGSDLATMQGVKDFIEYLKLKDSLNCGADLKDGYTKYGKVSKTADDYKLTFNDDFEGSKLNANVWGAYNSEGINSNVVSPSQLGGKISMRAPFDPGYTTYVTGRVVEQPAFVRDGSAVVTTARITETDVTFSRMSTFWHMIYQYGITEFKVKLAPNPVHTSLWMNGAGTEGAGFQNCFGREYRGCMTEYDLLENYGRVNNYDSAIHHWWGASSSRDPAHVSLPDQPHGLGTKNQEYVPEVDETNIYDEYHIFTFLWEDTGITFAFDGVKYYDFFVNETYFERMANYIIIGCGMANRDYGSPYNPEIHEDYYETLIDYIRIYQVENMGSVMKWAYEY